MPLASNALVLTLLVLATAVPKAGTGYNMQTVSVVFSIVSDISLTSHISLARFNFESDFEYSIMSLIAQN